MEDQKDQELQKLQLYEKQICAKAQEQTREIVSMLADLHEIYEAMYETAAQRDRKISQLEEENRHMQHLLEQKTKEADSYQKRASVYNKLELDTGRLASHILLYESRLEELNREKEQLAREKRDFETDRNQIRTKYNEAMQQLQDEKREKNDALQGRDQAITQQRQLKDDNCRLNELLTEKLEEIQTLTEKKCNLASNYKKLADEYTRMKDLFEKGVESEREKSEEVQEDLEWMRNYAIALDEKIMHYFDGTDEEALKSHFYNYLNNPAKWEEHRKRFPDFQGRKIACLPSGAAAGISQRQQQNGQCPCPPMQNGSRIKEPEDRIEKEKEEKEGREEKEEKEEKRVGEGNSTVQPDFD